jgi:hypothetical protein
MNRHTAHVGQATLKAPWLGAAVLTGRLIVTVLSGRQIDDSLKGLVLIAINISSYSSIVASVRVITASIKESCQLFAGRVSKILEPLTRQRG